MTAAVAAHAQPLEQTKKWGPHIDLEGKAGTDRNLGEIDLFVPLWQNADTLTFANIRARMDDDDSHEGNFGIGIRHMLDNGWNIGGYGYFDRRHSPYGNNFNQVTLGAEALSIDWDFRANVYMPFGTRSYLEDSLSGVDFSGASIMFRQGEERALSGFDGEIGWRTPLFEAGARQQLRLYAGGYRFTEDGVDSVQGPRGRLDLTFDEVPFLWKGSRLSLGAEIQHDDPRGTQSFVSFRLRVPFQIFGDAPTTRLSAMERRMTDPVIRDVDIVSRAGQFTSAAAITETADGKAINLVKADTTSGANLATVIQNAGNNSAVILSGDFTGVNALTTVNNGQTIIGSGALNVRTPAGRSFTIATPDSSISGTGANGGIGPQRFFDMADDSSLIGVTASINGAASSIIGRIDGKQNVTIRDNDFTTTVAGATAGGIQILDSHDVTIANNSLSADPNGGNSQFVVFAGTNSNIAIDNNAISLADSASLFVLAGGVTITDLSGSGNTSNVTTCNIVGLFTVTGSVTTSGTSCPP